MVGTRDKRDTKSFFKSREKMDEIGGKPSHVNHLHFSRGREKGGKNSVVSDLSESPAPAGGQFLNRMFRGQTLPVSYPRDPRLTAAKSFLSLCDLFVLCGEKFCLHYPSGPPQRPQNFMWAG